MENLSTSITHVGLWSVCMPMKITSLYYDCLGQLVFSEDAEGPLHLEGPWIRSFIEKPLRYCLSAGHISEIIVDETL